MKAGEHLVKSLSRNHLLKWRLCSGSHSQTNQTAEIHPKYSGSKLSALQEFAGYPGEAK